MRIAIIGAGNVGSTLGKGWAKAGHEVHYGVRSPRDARVQDLLSATGSAARASSVADAARAGEVVVLATPWHATKDAIEAAGSLAGKIVVDCTNPLKADLSGLELGHTTSGGEQVAAWAPGARVFKAFNTTGFSVMANPVINGHRTVMFVCGDDEAAKPAVMQLATDLGFEAVDAGKLAQARLLEPWAMLWISLALRGMGANFGFALLRPGA